MALLNTTVSIVDFLNVLKKPSDIGSREQLYKTQGLEARLGTYTGSGPQNTALLDTLRGLYNQGVTDFSKPAGEQVKTVQPTGGAQPTSTSPLASMFSISPTGQLVNKTQTAQPSGVPLSYSSSFGGAPLQSPFKVGGAQTTTTQGFPQQQKSPSGITVSQQQGRQPTPLPTNFVSQAAKAPQAPTIPTGTFKPGTVVSNETGEQFLIGAHGEAKSLKFRGFNEYTVREGDSLSRIAQGAGVSLEELLKLNPAFAAEGRTPNLIYPGEKVLVPQLRSIGSEESAEQARRAGYTDNDVFTDIDGKQKLVQGDTLINISEQEDLGEVTSYTDDSYSEEILKRLGAIMPSEQEILNDVFNSPDFKLARERLGLSTTLLTAQTEAAKAQLEAKFGEDKDTLEQKLASNGLAFSGIRTSQVAALEQTLASSLLAADRKLAAGLLEADLDLKEEVLNTVRDVIASAKDGRKEAIDQLNAVGMAVVGGHIVPTLAALKWSAERGDLAIKQNLDFQKFMLDQEKFKQLGAYRDQQIDIQLQRLEVSRKNAATAEEGRALLDQMRTLTLLKGTAVAPGQIINKAGLPVDLTQEQGRVVAGLVHAIEDEIPKLRDLSSQVVTGGIRGRLLRKAIKTPGAQRLLTAPELELIQTLSDLNQTVLYTRSGAQINEKEYVRLLETLPQMEFTNDMLDTALNSLDRRMRGVLARNLEVNGWSRAGSTTLEETPTGLAAMGAFAQDLSPEQMAELEGLGLSGYLPTLGGYSNESEEDF